MGQDLARTAGVGGRCGVPLSSNSDEVWPRSHTLCSPAKQGAADPSSLRESRRAAGKTEEKSEKRRETRAERREKRG